MASTAELTVDSSLKISEYADLFGFPAEAVLAAVQAQSRKALKQFYTVGELAERWNMSRQGANYVLRDFEAKVVNLGTGKKRRSLRIPGEVVVRIERQNTQLLQL